YRVVVLAEPAYAGSFAAVEGAEILEYRTADVMPRQKVRPRVTVGEARERVAEIEAELGLRLYKAAGSLMLYGRVVREFGGYWNYIDSEEEILTAFVDAYDHLVEIFETVRPDVIFYEA